MQAAPINIPYVRHGKDTRTPEQISHDEYEAFRTDAAMVAINAMLSMSREITTKVATTIKSSAQSDFRDRHQILHDYSKERDMPTAIKTLYKELNRNLSTHQSILDHLSRASNIVSQTRGEEDVFNEQYLERIDTCDSIFGPYVKRIRTELISLLRPVKCSDPNMFYLVAMAALISKRFNAMRNYIKQFAEGFRKGEQLAPIMYFNVTKPLITIAHRCNFRDKQGRELILLFDLDEEKEFAALSAKKSWQIKHPEGTYQVVNIYRDVYDSDRITRLVWELETKTLEIETIDKIIAQAEGSDPRYRCDWPFKNVMSCVNTYEQAVLNSTIALNRWSELPKRLRDFADSVARRKSIDPRRPSRPVAGFSLKPVTDRHGNPVRQSGSNDYEYRAVFIGIWNSISEASAEWGTSIHRISASVRGKAANDGRNNVWVDFETYVRSVHHSLSLVHPAYAQELDRLFPEYKLSQPLS